MLPVVVYLGAILVYQGLRDSHSASADKLPTLEGDWGPLKFKRLHTNAYHLDILENTFDFAHFPALHSFTEAKVTSPLTIEGNNVVTEYTLTRILPFKRRIEFNARVRLHGLGVAWTEMVLGGWKIRQLSLPRPLAQRESEIIVGITVSKRGKSRFARLFVAPIELILRSITLKSLITEYRRDFEIWENKIYLDHPKLVRNEGAIGKYRLWTRRFYAEVPLTQTTPSAGIRDEDMSATSGVS